MGGHIHPGVLYTCTCNNKYYFYNYSKLFWLRSLLAVNIIIFSFSLTPCVCVSVGFGAVVPHVASRSLPPKVD